LYGRKRRRVAEWRPRLETLESRVQPGSLLTTGLDLAVPGSSLDLHAEGTDATDSAPHQSLAPGLGSLNKTPAGGAVAVTPFQVTHSNTTTNSSLTLAEGNLLIRELPNTQGLAVAGNQLQPSPESSIRATASGRSRTTSLHRQDGLQTAQSVLTLSAPPLILAGRMPASVAIPVGVQSVDLKLHTVTVGDGHHPPYSGLWASYASNPASAGADTAALYKVVQVGGGSGATLYAIGEATDGSTGSQDIFIVATAANSRSATVATLGSLNPGDAKGYGIALDTAGILLIVGTVTDGSGNTAGVVASVTPNLTTLNWSFGFSGPSAVNGVTDVAGTVYFTGYGTDSSNQQDVLQGTTDEATGTNTSAFLHAFTGASSGNGIAVDANTGIVSIAAQVNGDPALLVGNLEFLLQGPGSLNAVVMDAAGVVHAVGSAEGPDGYQDLLIVTWDGHQLNSRLYLAPPAYDLKVDAVGNTYLELTSDDGTGNYGSHAQLFLEFDPAWNLIEFGMGGFAGSGDDYGFGIATDGAGNVYTVGKTDSPDFPTNGFQTMYQAGDPFEGWIAYATSP
jgi:hypothetical protein